MSPTAAPGGMPPKPPGPPGGLGAAAAPGGMPGNHGAGLGKVQAGIKMLMEALPQLQIGSELSNSVMDAVSKIGKHLGEGGMGGGDQGNLLQNLAMMARDVKQQPGPANALQGLMGGGGPPPGAGAPPPGAPPEMGA